MAREAGWPEGWIDRFTRIVALRVNRDLVECQNSIHKSLHVLKLRITDTRKAPRSIVAQLDVLPAKLQRIVTMNPRGCLKELVKVCSDSKRLHARRQNWIRRTEPSSNTF